MKMSPTRTTKKLPFFTVILEYRGGTYISQVSAINAQAAFVIWAARLDVSQINHLGEQGKKRLVESLTEDVYKTNHVVALAGLTNAWCGTVVGFAGLINIVKTARE